MKHALDFYLKQRRKIVALNYVGFVISWDMETDAAEQKYYSRFRASCGRVGNELSAFNGPRIRKRRFRFVREQKFFGRSFKARNRRCI